MHSTNMNISIWTGPEMSNVHTGLYSRPVSDLAQTLVLGVSLKACRAESVYLYQQ